jgi:putative flavoprotein involved in K+ transport
VVGPNHLIQLPGAAYEGDDPDGFMAREEIAGHLEAYADRIPAPVRTGCAVRRLGRRNGRGYLLDTDNGVIHSRVVVVATGAYQRPHLPPAARSLPAGLPCLDVTQYRNPADLPAGAVLVVGSGQSACQIAEELTLAGRDVFMACGRAPWFPRRPGGRDIFDWLLDSPFFDQPPEKLPTPAARFGANPQVTGAAGGHDLSYRTLHSLGVRLGGHLMGADEGTIRLAPDFAESLAAGDAAYAMLRELVFGVSDATGVERPDLRDPTPLRPDPMESIPARELGAVVVAAGFRSRYTEWVDLPGVVDDLGFPVHVNGESVVAPDLHFVGVHFLRKRRSSLLFGVGEDATATAELVAGRL